MFSLTHFGKVISFHGLATEFCFGWTGILPCGYEVNHHRSEVIAFSSSRLSGLAMNPLTLYTSHLVRTLFFSSSVDKNAPQCVS